MQTLRELPGFAAGTKPQPGLKPGTFPAYMQPVHEVIGTQNGEAVKVRYLVAYKGPGFWRGTEISELCNAPSHADPATGEKVYDFTENSKYVQRLAAVNRTDGASLDLGTADRGGWVLAEIVKDPKNDQYFKVNNVMALPDGMALPKLRQGPFGFVTIDNGDVSDRQAQAAVSVGESDDNLPF